MNPERQILDSLTAAGGAWMTQAQIRKATGMPRTRVINYTLTMSLEGKIGRTLTPCHHTQLFRALAPHETGTGALIFSDPPGDCRDRHACPVCKKGG